MFLKRRAGEDRLPDDAVPPGNDVAFAIETSLDAMHVDRPIPAALHVILARPDHLDRHRFAIGLSDLASFPHEVRVCDRSAAK